jgi:hypothetical protein
MATPISLVNFNSVQKKQEEKKLFNYFKSKFFRLFAVLFLCMALPSLAGAFGTIKVDDDKWFKIGAGIRSSFSTSNSATGTATGSATDFALDNMRVYTLTKVHKNIVFEFNTEVRETNERTTDLNAKDRHDIFVLDAVAKFSIKGFDVWAGKFLPPSDRSNLNGPYFLNVYDFPVVQNYPAIAAGRDLGVAIMKEYGGGKFKWSYGMFEGRTAATNSDTSPDDTDNLLHAARFTYNFWTPEPGYYTTSSYYGAKDVLALAFVYQYESDGAGTGTTGTTQGDFTGWNLDLLMEKKLSNGGVVNLEGAYYDYDTDDIADGTLIQGDGYLALASYLLPNPIGWGKFQPYVRYQHFDRELGAARGTRSVTEGGFNYIIDGHNAKMMVFYSGDKNGSNAATVDTFKIGMQFQLL